ncbi:unnamed protein product [Moneuplotes crassus]|uniref:chitin synthase n=1 Tax=Euplotes crassus TaxID=5936 RepID=A0AAD1XVT5_EUPCR|nr:unnamed protein product [Moneuplotes crassus]
MNITESSKEEGMPPEHSHLANPPQGEDLSSDTEVSPVSELDCFRKEYKYTPLSLVNPDPFDTTNQSYIMKQHQRKADEDWDIEDIGDNDIDILEDTLIGYGIYKNQPKMLMCITMFNEDPKRLVESLAGVYRAYYELLDLDPTFLNRVHVVIITDGYETLLQNQKNREVYDKANIHSINKVNAKKYVKAPITSGSKEITFTLENLAFINTENMISRKFEHQESKDEEAKIEFKDIKAYGANNIGHCFSRVMDFSEWEKALSKQQRSNFFINGYDVYDFLSGDDSIGNVKTQKYKHYPLPIHFVVKHQNQGKLESYKWFYRGFCQMMNPKYVQLIECGAIPLWNSISRIIMHMEAFPDVGGACGEVEVKLIEKKSDEVQQISFVESSMLRSQYVEYKVSHYMDKATESLFGFVTSLPSLFSTFRWECIDGRPVSQTLKGANDYFRDVKKTLSCYTSNKYLTEDRILAMEILNKENHRYITHYVPGAKCLVDCPISLTGLIKERRRIFNGWMFSSFYMLKSGYRMWKRKGSSFMRNIFLMILYFYLAIVWILYFCSLGLFYSAFSVFIRAVLPSNTCISVTMASNVTENIYLIFLFIVLMLSIAIKVRNAELGFKLCAILMGSFSLFMVYCAIMFAIKKEENIIPVCLIAFFTFSFLIPLILNFWNLYISDTLKGILYGFYLLPTYINIFTIFAMANIHEVASETVSGSLTKDKELDAKVREAAKEKYEGYQYFRSLFLMGWLCVNFGVGAVITGFDRNDEKWFISYLGFVLAGVISFKLAFSGVHRIVSWIHHCYVSCYVSKLRRKYKESVHSEVRGEIEEDKEFTFVPTVVCNREKKADTEESIMLDLRGLMNRIKNISEDKGEDRQVKQMERMLTKSKKTLKGIIPKKTEVPNNFTRLKRGANPDSESLDYSNDPFGSELSHYSSLAGGDEYSSSSHSSYSS